MLESACFLAGVVVAFVALWKTGDTNAQIAVPPIALVALFWIVPAAWRLPTGLGLLAGLPAYATFFLYQRAFSSDRSTRRIQRGGVAPDALDPRRPLLHPRNAPHEGARLGRNRGRADALPRARPHPRGRAETVRPFGYGRRTWSMAGVADRSAHLHVKIRRDGETFTSQLWFPDDDERNPTDIAYARFRDTNVLALDRDGAGLVSQTCGRQAARR